MTAARADEPLIAVDAMGGDHAPVPEVAGAVAAVHEHGARVLLLGDEARLRAELERTRIPPGSLGATGLTIRDCKQVITMEDAPGQAARRKRDASMRVAFELVRSGQADGVVSAGNTGAMLACGLLVLGRLSGLDRPGILATVPALDPAGELHRRVLLDVGANVDCRPQTLAQFAVLGATYARLRYGLLWRPRVALLSNGAEPSKGTAALRKAYELLARAAAEGAAEFDFVGYVEGHELFSLDAPRGGAADVVVTDGFTGNIALKTAEGAARLMGQLFRHRIGGTYRARLGAMLMRSQLRLLQREIDVERRGGAPLLGVSGVAIICHGRAGARAIAAAISMARDHVQAGMIPALAAALERHRALWDDGSREPAGDAPA